MGILADLFVSVDEDAKEYQESLLINYQAHLSRFEPAQFRNLSSLEFGTLWALLEHEEWDIDKHDLEEVMLIDDGEAWLFRFPINYVTKLATLDDAEIEQYASQWAATDELAHWSAADTTAVVKELVRLSKQSVSGDKNLYLWGSL